MIGFLVDSLTNDFKSIALVRNLEKIENSYIFYLNHFDLRIIPKLPVLHAEYANNFKGILVSTTENTTQVLSKCYTPDKYFYIWDLEWLTKNKQLKENLKFYGNDEIQLIARTEHHAELIENCWQKPAHIIEEFDYERVKDLATT